MGSFIESKMSINKSGASRPRRRSTFWQGIEWDTPIKFKTIDLYKALISSSSLMCEKRRQSYFILKVTIWKKREMEWSLCEFFSIYCFMANREQKWYCGFSCAIAKFSRKMFLHTWHRYFCPCHCSITYILAILFLVRYGFRNQYIHTAMYIDNTIMFKLQMHIELSNICFWFAVKGFAKKDNTILTFQRLLMTKAN